MKGFRQWDELARTHVALRTADLERYWQEVILPMANVVHQRVTDECLADALLRESKASRDCRP